MLTKVQESMIDHCVRLRVDILYSYFSKKESPNPGQITIDIINKACASPISDSEFIVDEISHLMSLSGKNPTERIIKELRGIFNPNYKILNKLFVINNVRDTETISEADLTSKANEIKIFAYERLEKIISKHKQLKEFFYQLLFVKKEETKEQEEFKQQNKSI